jgi:hypothetical protein
MKKIGEYDLFFDFFMFQSKRWLGMKKKVTIPKVVAIFKRENFLNIGKNRNSLAIRNPEKKDHWFKNLTFFFASFMEMQTSNPALREYFLVGLVGFSGFRCAI